MVSPDIVDPPMDKAETKGTNCNSCSQVTSVTNGNHVDNSTLDNKIDIENGPRQPSYVALACSISGYTTLTYDSKQRQGLRSRPASPIKLSNGNQNVIIANYRSDCGNYLSPQPQQELNLKMDSRGKGVEILNGCSSLSSPRHISNITKSATAESRRNFTSSMVSESYSSYNSNSSNYSYSSTTSASYSSTNGEYTNGSRLLCPVKAPPAVSPSSFIVQRVERLYGPGALAQGFYSPRRTQLFNSGSGASITPDANKKNSTNNNNIQIETNEERVDSPLPVLKLLRPEFRAQLTVASRKARTGQLQQPPTGPVVREVPIEIKRGEDEKDLKKLQDDVVDSTLLQEKVSQLSIEEEVKEGHHFLKLLDLKVAELEELARRGEMELECCSNEEGCGVLRAASGKARLLVAEKLNQFRGLCHKNIKQTGEESFPTTNEDLAGFWDMVVIQVNQVVALFEEIDQLKKNDWKQLTPVKVLNGGGSTPRNTSSHKRPILKKATPATTDPKQTAASKARDEARRKLIEEKRKAMREAMENGGAPDVVLL